MYELMACYFYGTPLMVERMWLTVELSLPGTHLKGKNVPVSVNYEMYLL